VEFPQAKMNATLLRQIYRQRKIKKKKLRWFKQPKEADPEKARQWLITMKRLLTRAKNDGYRIIYLDETCFTRTTVAEAEWSLPRENTRVDQVHMNEPTLALLAAISKEKGQEHFMVFPKSVNVQKFKQYLTALRQATGEDKVCLFMDNLSAHTSDKAKEKMKELGFRWIYNVPYAPDYNPIETVFSKVKQKFKTLRLQKMCGLRQDGHEALVAKAINAVRKKDIVNSVNHA